MLTGRKYKKEREMERKDEGMRELKKERKEEDNNREGVGVEREVRMR
jgi:hypothetical protein